MYASWYSRHWPQTNEGINCNFILHSKRMTHPSCQKHSNLSSITRFLLSWCSRNRMSSGKEWASVEPKLRCLDTIKKLGFPTMTPVQAACLPAFLSHKDVCVQVELLQCFHNLSYILAEAISFCSTHEFNLSEKLSKPLFCFV